MRGGTDDVKEVVVEDVVDGLRVWGEQRQARVGRVVFDQSNDVGREHECLSTHVEVDRGQTSWPELCRAAEQRLSASLGRQVEQDDRTVLAGTDQLVLHIDHTIAS